MLLQEYYVAGKEGQNNVPEPFSGPVDKFLIIIGQVTLIDSANS